MDKDVFYAILAMDAYNRGYGQHIAGLPVSGKLGGATIIADSSILRDADGNPADTPVGFYAIAYEWNGKTILSFRGTNPDSLDNFRDDAINGFTLGAGSPYGAQARLALRFYQEVSGVDKGADPFAVNVATTGHSLGGGLGGFVAALYGKEATIFDNMTFDGGARRAFETEDAELKALIYRGQEPVAPDWDNIKAYATTGEILTFLLALRHWQNAGIEYVNSNGGTRDPVALHSQALLVSLLWARDFGRESWKSAAEQVWNSFLSGDPATGLPGASAWVGPAGSAATILQEGIAYSALDAAYDDAAKPFGDTGIWSMFDDASDIGRGLEVQTTGILDGHVRWQFGLDFETKLKDALADIAVQYAGALAIYDVEEADVRAFDSKISAKDGVLRLNSDESILALDISSVMWGDVLKQGNSANFPAGLDRVVPVGAYDIASAFFEQSEELDGDLINAIRLTLNLGGRIDEDLLKQLAEEVWLTTDARIFDRYHFLLKDGGGEIKLSERPYDPGPLTGPQAHVDVAIGTSGEEKLTGTKGNDLLLLGNGDDTVYTLSGRDLVIAGAGDDTIVNNIVAEVRSRDSSGERDVFIGQRLNSSITETFLKWLLAGGGGAESAADQYDYWSDDVVRYSVADPETGALAEKGATIVDLKLTRFGEHDAIEITIKDLNSGTISTDLLLNIDVAELSERAERVELTGDMSKVPLVIDFGGPKQGLVFSSDFDTVSFAGRTSGMQTINGSTKDYQGDVASTLTSLAITVAAKLAREVFNPLLGTVPELHFRDAENVELTGDDDVYFGGNVNQLFGVGDGFFGEANHPGFGTISGGGGRDILVHYGAVHKEAGERISTAEGEHAVAGEELRMTVDGGEGNDWVVAIGGEKAITAGGLGRDWIFNTSKGGELYGDYYGGLSPDGEPAPDTGENSDNFWYWADTTIMDAQHFDVLKYFGIPLTGGDANGGIAGLALGGMFGSAIGMANLAGYLTGQTRDWTGEVYVDHLQPWIIYTFKRDEDGVLDMYITNAFEQIFRGMMAAIGIEAGPSSDAIHKGWMKVENVDVIGSRLGVLQAELTADVFAGRGQGDLSMVFRAVNPLQALMPLLMLVPGAIGMALYYSVFADALISTVAAATRFAKALAWAEGTDPLVIDLDGDGIETVSREHSRAYFDIDGDLFRERTGWLKGDDGFLVLDANGNGRVDDIAELFGNRAQGGFAELAAYDSDGDGKITVADVIWSDLQVWQDRDRDGETDAGELKSLDALGILSLSLESTPLDVMTPQNARLLARSEVTFAGGRTTKMFEAIFTANEIDTKFAGEAGFAPWQSNDMLNAKGFGTITDLAVAAANDPEFAELAQARATAMTTPKLKTLIAQAGDVLGQWT